MLHLSVCHRHVFLDSSKREYVVCKIVQRGDWSGYVDYKSVPMLSSKNKDTKVLDV